MIKLLIVDDHALVRTGFRKLLADADDMIVLDEFSSGEDAIKALPKLTPDVVLLDMKMPGLGGIETTKRLIRADAGLKIIAVTAFGDDPYPLKVLQAGARGFLTKTCGADEMLSAIRQVMRGERYIDKNVAQQLAMRSLHEPDQAANPLEQLSERELQIMLMITSGSLVTEIADKLCLSPKTINSYRYRLFEKLGVRSDVELTHLAIRHGLLDKSYEYT